MFIFLDTETSGKHEDDICISIVVVNGVDTGKYLLSEQFQEIKLYHMLFFIRLPRTIGIFAYFASEKGTLINL